MAAPCERNTKIKKVTFKSYDFLVTLLFDLCVSCCLSAEVVVVDAFGLHSERIKQFVY